MTLFPRIARPCPYVDRLDAIMDGDFCRMCKRDVHDLTDMDRAAREAFLADCGGEVCVRYTVLMKPAMAAAALAVSAGGISVLAASLNPHPSRAQDQAGTTPVLVTGAPVPLAGEIAMPPDPRPTPSRPRQARPPEPKPPRPVLVPEVPYVLAGMIAPIDPPPGNAVAPTANETAPID